MAEIQYFVGLCRLTDRGLSAAYESETINAPDLGKAMTRAAAWAKSTIGIISERTWLQILLDGKSVYSEELVEPF
jgi:hypothetical protein